MSLYEVLAVVTLVCVGGFAYYLYRSDTRGKPPGTEIPSGEGMFRRTSPAQTDDGAKPAIAPSSSRDGKA